MDITTITEDTTLKEIEIPVPAWIDDDITIGTIDAVNQGGCMSGAYMPAVTYSTALDTMREHGDDVLDYIETVFGNVPTPQEVESWAGLAVWYLSMAVELYCSLIEDEIADLPRE